MDAQFSSTDWPKFWYETLVKLCTEFNSNTDYDDAVMELNNLEDRLCGEYKYSDEVMKQMMGELYPAYSTLHGMITRDICDSLPNCSAPFSRDFDYFPEVAKAVECNRLAKEYVVLVNAISLLATQAEKQRRLEISCYVDAHPERMDEIYNIVGGRSVCKIEEGSEISYSRLRSTGQLSNINNLEEVTRHKAPPGILPVVHFLRVDKKKHNVTYIILETNIAEQIRGLMVSIAKDAFREAHQSATKDI